MTQVKVLQSRSLLEQATDRLLKDKKTRYGSSTNRLAALRKVLHLAPKPALDQDEAVRAAAGSIKVKGSNMTRIIEITCDSTDPRLAADFANTLVDEFIQKNMSDRWKTTERTGEWLTTQLDGLKIKLEKSEDSLQSYALAAGLRFTGAGAGGEQENVVSASVRLLQEELLKARAERMIAQSRFELVQSSPPDALPQVLDDISLRDYESKLVDLRRQRAELSSSFTPAHPRMQKLEAQITELETTLETTRQKVVTRLRNDYAAAGSHEKLLHEEFTKQLNTISAQAAKEVHYSILRREVETNRQLYESMLTRVKESSIASAMQASNFRIVDLAEPADLPYKPNPVNNAMLGSMAGIFLGVVLVLLKEQADRSIQQPGDSTLYLGISELGVIPSDRPARFRRGQGTAPLIPIRNGAAGNSVELVTWQRQGSLIAESFRTVLTSIMFSGQRPRVLVISSANPSEGKTTVSTNLSIALSEISQRVLLIDADMRRPRLHRVFNMENDKGLSELLRKKHSIESSEVLKAVRETSIPGLHVLTSGPWAANASTLLYSARLPEIVDITRQNFDTVIIDSPPMLHMADARLLAKQCDSVLMVLRAGKTTRAAAVMAIQKFVADGSTVLGTILTDYNPDQNGYSYDYKYYSSHADYYTDSDTTNDLKAVGNSKT
jgi:capsular exopolysaccharide synthesis family protein